MNGETGVASGSSGTFASCETSAIVAPCPIELKNPAPQVSPPACDWPAASSWVVSAEPAFTASVTSTP